MTEPRATKVPGRRRGLALLAGNLALVAAAVLGSLLVCELLLRLFGVNYPVFVWADPIRGVAHIPGARSAVRSDGTRWIEINSDGLRGPEASLTVAPGTLRVALLGDSFIEGFDVQYQHTAGEVLERRLSELRGAPVEVLNFGVGGYGTTQELLTLQHEVWKYSPDLVLLGVTTGNDIADNYRPLKRSEFVPYHVFQGESLVVDSSFLESKGYRDRALWTRKLFGVVRYSRVAQLVNRVRRLRRGDARRSEHASATPGDEVGLRDEVHLPPTTPHWREAWRVSEAVLRLMKEECRRKSTPFAIVTLTRSIQVTPIPEKKQKFLEQLGAEDVYYAERRLAEFGKREGVPVFNLAYDMAEAADQRKVYFHSHEGTPGIGHWNVEGNRIAGELIASWLEAQRLTDRSASALRP